MQLKVNSELTLRTIMDLIGFTPPGTHLFTFSKCNGNGYGNFINIHMKMYVLHTTATFKQYYLMSLELENALD